MMAVFGAYVTRSNEMTVTKRLVARLDIKGPNLIKGVQLEGLKVVGDPSVFALNYFEEGIDEIIYMDIVASLYGRNSLTEIIRKTADEVFVPLTVGGGVRSVQDVRELLNSGADKVAINTAAIRRPQLLKEVSETLGAQCVVLSVEAKRVSGASWEVFTDNGRERTGYDIIEWVTVASQTGIGEILLTSVDNEGTRRGLDLDLIKRVSSAVDVPVIASGGLGSPRHLVDALSAGADAVATADALHFNRHSIADLRRAALGSGFAMRSLPLPQ
ncbi:MAG: imidazole glycerol phosphate synthase subunit HisF [Ilumatobacteraceae bacterium]